MGPPDLWSSAAYDWSCQSGNNRGGGIPRFPAFHEAHRTVGVMRRIGVLTAGGDVPGLSVGISEVCSRVMHSGATPILIPDGFAGLQQSRTVDFDMNDLHWASRRGGSLIGSSRTKVKDDESVGACHSGAENLKLDGLIVFGGDGSLQGAAHLARTGLCVVGIPKTVDNDIGATDRCIGFDTAVETGLRLVEQIDDTRWSHSTNFIVEVMGRRSGWLAAGIAQAAGVAGVIVPESEWSVRAVLDRLSSPRGGIIVVAEAAWSNDLGALRLAPNGKPVVGGVGQILADTLAMSGAVAVRSVVLGHTLRGGSPVASDRLLARSFAATAARCALEGRSAMVRFRHGRVEVRGIEKAFAPRRHLDRDALDLLAPLLICD